MTREGRPAPTVAVMDEAHTWGVAVPRVITNDLVLDFAMGADFTAWVTHGLDDRVRFLGSTLRGYRPPRQISRSAWAADWYRAPETAWWEQ